MASSLHMLGRRSKFYANKYIQTQGVYSLKIPNLSQAQATYTRPHHHQTYLWEARPEDTFRMQSILSKYIQDF